MEVVTLLFFFCFSLQSDTGNQNENRLKSPYKRSHIYNSMESVVGFREVVPHGAQFCVLFFSLRSDCNKSKCK